jgi:hypothetical protein
MASKSSKALPYIAVFAVIGLGLIEALFDVNIPLEEMTPVLVTVGIGGAGLAAVKAVSIGKKIATPEIKKLLEDAGYKLVKD